MLFRSAFVGQSNSVVLGNNANVGIGTSTPGSKLTVAGLIETTTGGVKFPDGTIQLSAAVGGGGLPPGSPNYIQSNPTSQQAGVSFNISGNGTAGGTLTANVVNTTTQFNLGGNRVLSTAGNSNLFVGAGSGQANTSGASNAFVGASAGLANTIGARNAFFGFNAGRNNVGDAFGNGSDNSFFGSSAGSSNTGQQNAFFGRGAGAGNTSGSFNSFFGEAAGLNNTTGGFNTFIGSNTGFSSAGPSNTSGSNDTALGLGAMIGLDAGNNNVTNATAIGANGFVTRSNSLVLGSINGVNGAAADTLVGIGTTEPGSKLEVHGIKAGLTCNVVTIVYGNARTLPGCGDALGVTTDDPTKNLIDGANNSGTVFQVGGDGEIRTLGALSVGTFSPVRTLTVNGRARIGSIPPEASAASVCFNAAGDLLQCGASSLRFKTDVHPFLSGLDIIRRLHPISFNWKDGSGHDIGLGAEDVAKVAPSFTFTDRKGEITGVKYDRLNILLINAVKEQQKQIATLVTSNAALNARLRGVEKSLRKKAGSARRRR